jgi:signal transduction histidine kinase/streptogramin lyase
LPVDEVWALAMDSTGRLWAATRDGLAQVDRAAVGVAGARPVVRVLGSREGLPTSNVKAVYADDRALWVGTTRGIAEVTVGESGAVVVGRRLTGFYAWRIAADRNGDIWVATDAGARKLTRHGLTTWLADDGLPAPLVSAVTETRDGHVCATMLAGRVEVACFDGTRFERVRIGAVEAVRDPGWGWSQLTLQDRHGRWWLPTGEGLFWFDAVPLRALATAAPRAVFDAGSGLQSDNVFRLFEDSAGHVWVATFSEAGNGLARIDTATGALEAFDARHGLPADLPIVHAFAEDRARQVWVGLEKGVLLRYRGRAFETIPIHEGAGRGAAVSEHLRALLADRQGRVWIASSTSGLGRIDDPTAASPRVSWYGTARGLSSNTAWVLAQHASGDLFVGTARGIDRFDPATGRVARLSADAGVPRGELWGALADRTGRLWFASSAGLARLDRLVDPRAADPPATFVMAVRVGGEPLPVAATGMERLGGVIVGSGERRIEIDYVSPGASEADGLRYQHRLEGVDRDWTWTDGRTVALAGAAPGRYAFLVRAVLASGTAGVPARVEFTVLAPVWRRWWFVTLVLVGLAALVYAFHRARVRRLLDVERVRARIAADLHDGVGASLSRIAILSELVRRRTEALVPETTPQLAAIADNARDVIEDMSDAVWSIDPRLDTLQEVVVRARSMAAELFDEGRITWSIEAPAAADRIRLAPEQRRHVFLVLKEALTNVARHARATNVSVKITSDGRRLRLEIADDGRGVDGDGPPDTAGSGRGIGNMEVRARALGGRLSVGPGSDGRGTLVALDVPTKTTA